MQNKLITRNDFEKRIIELFAGKRLEGLPKRRRDKAVLLKALSLSLNSSREYKEAEINDLIREWLEKANASKRLDHVTLRRELVDEGFISRPRDGSRYWVTDPRENLFEEDVDSVDVIATITNAREELEKTRRVKGEVRKKILNAALECFSAKGYEGASIRDIADKAGVTLPNIYYYFKDKEGLYQAVLNDTVSDLMEILTKLDDPEASFRDRFIALGKAKMRMAGQKNASIELFIKEMISSGITSPGLTPSLANAMQTGLKYLEDMISVAAKKGEIKPINPKIGVLYLISLSFVHGSKFITQFIKNREPMSDEEIEEFVDLIMKGLERK